MPTLKQYYGDYTKDVVFVPDKGYMTKAQQKAMIQRQKNQKARRLARQASTPAAPTTTTVNLGDTRTTTTTVPATAPYQKGSAPSSTQIGSEVYLPNGSPHPAGTESTRPGTESTRPGQYTPSTIPTTPGWYIPKAYTNPTAEQAFANAANALLPSLSPEDQRTMANYLATNFKDVFGSYANAQFAPIPTKLTTERQNYLNPQRAQWALDRLNKFATASGSNDLGAGYDFLRNAVGLLTQYNSGPMTREQYDQFQNEIKNMSASVGNNVKAYSNLAQMFNLPSFSAGPLVSNSQNAILNV